MQYTNQTKGECLLAKVPSQQEYKKSLEGIRFPLERRDSYKHTGAISLPHESCV